MRSLLTDKGQAVKAGEYENKIATDMKAFADLMEELLVLILDILILYLISMYLP